MGNADAGYRQCANDHDHKGDFHMLGHIAHFAHILLMVHAMDHTARAQEQ